MGLDMINRNIIFSRKYRSNLHLVDRINVLDDIDFELEGASGNNITLSKFSAVKSPPETFLCLTEAGILV